ncbi:type IV pilin biogenesis protein [Marinomonas spartinae]|uniref:Type IV pilin biogenesis protein n=1 Tax=Marinomonas spartinae TaxID=1792290 RepID=A0A1A8TN12_9GAMM|nr:type II secretion system F family protein [Marinomonas spartinae]SBS34553.1 type IV pilin biogenesis protein [Marinomonas spartinae]
MPWYKIQSQKDHKQYHFFDSEKDLQLFLINQGTWRVKWSVWHPKKFNYKRLLGFYQELQSALQSGFQINQAIDNLSQISSDSHLSKNSQAILEEMKKGTDFNRIISNLSTTHAQAYCKLIRPEGSREDLEQSLSVSILQLETLLNWSNRLLKSIAYPFCIIQISLIMKILHTFFLTKATSHHLLDILLDISLYSITTLIQGYVAISLANGNASNLFERLNPHFRLAKLFALLETTRKTGSPLQQALYSMPRYFEHSGIKHDILMVYYKLKLGQDYQQSFPIYWFPNEARVALHSTSQGGSIERALKLAKLQHTKKWSKAVSLYEKLIPALCLIIAGSFVTSSLLSLYRPLLEIP